MKKFLSLNLLTLAAGFLFLCVSCSHTKSQVSGLEGLSSEASSESSENQNTEASTESNSSDKEAFVVPETVAPEASAAQETSNNENKEDSVSNDEVTEGTSAFAVPAEKAPETVEPEAVASVTPSETVEEVPATAPVTEVTANAPVVTNEQSFLLAKEKTEKPAETVKNEVVEKDIASLIATAENQENSGVENKGSQPNSEVTPSSPESEQGRDIDSKHKKKWRKKRHHRRGKTAENQETDELNAFVDQEAENAGRSDKFKSKAKLAYAEMSAFVGKNLFPLALVMVGTLIGTFFVIRRNRKSDQSL